MKSRTESRGRRYAVGLLLVVGSCCWCGCGSDGPPRYRVEGTVDYGGAAVKAGRVIFEPDTTAGNSGPAAYADIRDGRYTTIAGLGNVGGPHRLRVICLTGQPEGSELAEGRMLCPEFRDTVDLPHEHTEYNIEIPGDLSW